MAVACGAGRRRLRNAALRLVDRLPFAKRRLVRNLSGVSRRELATLAA